MTGDGAGMTDDRRVTKVIRAVNGQWLKKENRRSEKEIEDNQKSG